MSVERPILRYHGSKWRLAQWVVSHFPPHRVYVEPFGGSAAVLLQKPAARTEIYNDKDSDVVAFFRVIRDPEQSRKLAELIEASPFSRDEYNISYEPTSDPVENARRFLARSFMGMGSKGIWYRSGFDVRVNPDAYTSRVAAFRALPRVIAQCAERLQNVILENCDGIELIERFSSRTDTLIYVDPPYVLDSYSGKQVYACRLTDDDHRRLAGALNATESAVVVSGYHSPLYDELFAGWHRWETQALADAGVNRTEVLWCRNITRHGWLDFKSPQEATA